ncbi:hypothetical protein LINGRAHAP2_LOCUS34182 [Linum grandiflorum]
MVRVAAMEYLLELGDVQPYVINSAQVVFLNERPTKNGSSSPSGQATKCWLFPNIRTILMSAERSEPVEGTSPYMKNQSFRSLLFHQETIGS